MNKLNSLVKVEKGQQKNRSELSKVGQYPVINGGILPSGYTNKFNKLENKITISEGGNSCGFVSFQDSPFWSGGHCYTLEPLKNDFNYKYLYFYLKYNQRKIQDLRVGSGLPNIQKKKLELFDVYLPVNIIEQDQIVSALSSIQKTIFTLEKLIQKKKFIFKGIKQDLLTGRKRLPGFSENWISQKLAKVGNFYKGKGISKDQIGTGNIACIRYGELYTKYDEIVDEIYSFISEDVAQTSFKIFKNDIVFTGSGETVEDIGKATSLYCNIDNVYASSDTVILRLFENYDANFMSFYLNSDEIVKQKSSLSQGHTVVHITSKQLKEINISIPPAKDEQRAIFLCLLEFRKNLQEYQQKLSKLEKIKNGMEEQLLTGQVRLPLN